MAKSDKLAYAEQTDDGVVTDIKGYNPKGYDGEFGVYSSNIYFVGDFEEELATQKFYDPAPPMPEMAEVDRQKGQQNGYKNL